jgi:hypothetical protein
VRSPAPEIDSLREGLAEIALEETGDRPHLQKVAQA